ncbi:MAG: carboxypeptidase regulatory-like domain-containing protein [Bacteroidales bacterium]|nr:carboxypeptidase regulatory-like domain-containing protein [Bacteroidales bacterium]
MNKLKYFILIVAVAVGGILQAQSQRELGKLMRDRGEFYFTLSVNQPTEIQAVSGLCSVDGTDGSTVVCYANQQEYDRLLQAGYQPTLLTPPSMREEAKMWKGGDRATYEWDSYLTYEQYVTMMEGFPADALSGRTCTLLDLGTLSTSNHRKILGVRINNGQPEGKPKFLYTSTMHGDEITGMILMLRLINELCTSTNSRIASLVNSLDIYIFPLTNPDGTYYGGNNTVTGARRYNGNNIDLNRNYKDYFMGEHPDNNSYQDETLWTMQLADENLFTMSANYHGGAEVMNYPWDAVYNDHADKDWYEYVCTEYVQLARQTYSSYMSDTYSDGVTNGATWYVITGSRQDYMNAYGQCREVTVECSTTKTPDASELPNFWNYNHNSMLVFMEQCLNGVHGFVYDAQTNEPLQGVTVTVQNHDVNNSFVTTHSIGDFHRPIKGGTYTFVFSKNGYYPQSVVVTVADGQRVDLDPIYLQDGAPIPEEPDIVNMQNGTFETCNALFYDSGGENANYGNNLDYTLTINPSSAGAKVSVEFTQFNVESNYDFLYIYDGSSTSATQIGQYSGTTSPGTVTATNEAGALTFRFTSDNSVNKTGWAATISCIIPPTPIIEQTVTLSAGLNWWSPNVDTDGATLLSQLENALGTNGVKIMAQNGSYVVNSTEGWSGNLTSLEIGKMYMIQTSATCEVSIEGNAVALTNQDIILASGNNWIGYFGTQATPVSTALSGFSATVGDVIMTQDGRSTTYSAYGWGGTLSSFEPGQGYIYNSKSTSNTTLNFR